MQKRRQLTLFVPHAQSEVIEKIRAEFNPVQFRIINAHVTLCREDEIEPLDQIISNLQRKKLKSVTLSFDAAIRFSEGKGVLLPVANFDDSFQNLRREILSNIVENPREHQAHITLMHPRNSTATETIFEEIKQVDFPKTITFNEICLIEQESKKEWKILQRFPLK
jgi:hypothetical protein